MTKHHSTFTKTRALVGFFMLAMLPGFFLGCDRSLHPKGTFSLSPKDMAIIETVYADGSLVRLQNQIPLTSGNSMPQTLGFGNYDPVTRVLSNVSINQVVIPYILLDDQGSGSFTVLNKELPMQGFDGCQIRYSLGVNIHFASSERLDVAITDTYVFSTSDVTKHTCEDLLNQIGFDIQNGSPIHEPLRSVIMAGHLDIGKIKTLRSIQITTQASGVKS